MTRTGIFFLSVFPFLHPIDSWSFAYCFFRFVIKDNNKHQNEIDCDWQQVIGLSNIEKEKWNLILGFILLSFSLVEQISTLVAVISDIVHARFIGLKLQNKTICLIH